MPPHLWACVCVCIVNIHLCDTVWKCHYARSLLGFSFCRSFELCISGRITDAAPTFPPICACVFVQTCARPHVFFLLLCVFLFSTAPAVVCCGLLFEPQWASVWFNRKFVESLLCSQIRTERDYCNDLRGRLGVRVCMCVWAGVLSLVEWNFNSLEPSQVEGALPAKHPHRAPLVPNWFRTYLRIRQKTDERKI